MKDTYLHRIAVSESSCLSCDGTGAFDLFDGVPCCRCNGTGVHWDDDPGSSQQKLLRLSAESEAYFRSRALRLAP